MPRARARSPLSPSSPSSRAPLSSLALAWAAALALALAPPGISLVAHARAASKSTQPARLKLAIDDGVPAAVAKLDGTLAPYLQVEGLPLRARLRALARRSSAAAKRRREGALAAGRAALAAARAAYKKLEFAAVTARCQAAEVPLRQAAVERGDVALLGELLLLRAQAHLALKQAAAAQQALAFAIDLGVVRAGAGRFPPETEQVIAKLRGARGAGSLSVSSQPAGAEVLIDGRARGHTPTTVRLAAGVHLVRVRAVGQRDKVTLQTVAAARVSQLAVTLTAATAGETARQLLVALSQNANATPARRRALLDRAARALGADGWVARAGADAATVELAYVGASPPRRSTLRCAGVRCRAVATRALYTLARGVPPPATLPPNGPTPFYKRWWFWTIVAGVVAGATATGIVLGTRTPSGVDVYGVQR